MCYDLMTYVTRALEVVPGKEDEGRSTCAKNKWP